MKIKLRLKPTQGSPQAILQTNRIPQSLDKPLEHSDHIQIPYIEPEIKPQTQPIAQNQIFKDQQHISQSSQSNNNQQQKKQKQNKQIVHPMIPSNPSNIPVAISLVDIQSLSQQQLIQRAIENVSRHNMRIRRNKIQTKQIIKAIQRNRIMNSSRSSFPSLQYPFVLQDIYGRNYYNNNGGQHLQSGSIQNFIKKNLTQQKSGFVPDMVRYQGPTKRRRIP